MTDIIRPKALVITGDGILCETETAQAFATAGFEVHLRHLNDLNRDQLKEVDLYPFYSVIAIPGGASVADDLGSGKLLALRIQHALGWSFTQFAARGGMVIGIGNGFQALIRMGIFGKDLSITHNPTGKTIQAWVKVAPVGQTCVWLKGLGVIDLPIRHDEGRLVIHPNRKTETLVRLQRRGMNCLKYEGNPTGSEEGIAGLCDTTGRILGIMAHPESFVRWTAHPEWTMTPSRANAPGQGLALFENAYQEAMRATQSAP